MPDRLLDGIRVLDLGGDPAARAARVLADLGAEVVRVVPDTGDVIDGNVARAWNANKRLAPETELDALLLWADIVFDTPGMRGTLAVDSGRAPQAVWVSITPFGLTGPHASWRASDLGVMAASGNMFSTGDPDRAPVRCTEPSGYAHSGAEAAFAALTALWTGVPQRVDVSMQEVVLVANMATPARFPQTGFRGSRRGANIGRTREIWPTLDGFVSFGLRGGKARIPSLEKIAELAGLPARDWSEFSPNTATDDALKEIETLVAAYFAQHTMQELYDIACETNLMLAPANSPKEIYASAQLASRDFFDDATRLPRSFVTTRYGARTAAAAAAPASKHDKAWGGVR
ncbi:MAG: CoA transferase, partial [Actinomycetota bacterium]|nr:CoA transferase [Actinomycetota bacterium]